MRLRVIVDSPDDFERWVAELSAAAPSRPGLAADGKSVYTANACVGCHTIARRLRRVARSRPHPLRQPDHAGRRASYPTRPRTSPCGSRDPQRREAGRQDAGPRPHRRPGPRPGRVPPQSEVGEAMATHDVVLLPHAPPARRRAHGPLELDHHRRPQADRHPLRDHRVRVLPARRARGAHHPPAAGPARQHPGERRHLQRALHHARHHDGVPRGHAVRRRLLQLSGAADDRGPRRGLSPAQRALLLDLPGRRPLPERELPGGRAPGRRLVRLREPHLAPVLAGRRHRFLAARSAGPGRVLGDRGRELHRDDPQHARARHDPHADAGLHLDDAGRPVPGPARLSARHRGPDLPDVRPLLRHPLLRRGGRAATCTSGSTSSGSSATPRSTS